MHTHVLVQRLRDFTVQIRRLSDDKAVGTGIVVSMDGKVATCAHVVKMAGVDPNEVGRAEVVIYFPQLHSIEDKRRLATITAFFMHHDDDLVLLQLVGGPAPLGPEQIAVLGAAELSEGNRFRSFGYAPLGPSPSSRADGTIQGAVDPPGDRRLRADPIQLKSSEIAPGMSGAPVLDVERNLVVGLISETWFPDKSTKHRDTAWAINARVLSLDPMNLAVQDASPPLHVARQPQVEIGVSLMTLAPNERIAWNNAPPSLEEWVGRESLLQALSSDWSNPNRTVTGLIGFGGEGKSSLARRWVDRLLANPSEPQPDGVFWWGFYTRPNMDQFFESLLDYFGGGAIDPDRYPSSSAKAHLITALLQTGRYLLVLDGLEAMQYQEGDQYGLLYNAELRELLTYVGALGHGSFCLVTSRAPLLDLLYYTSYTHREVERLSPSDGRTLLQRLGVYGEDEAIDQIVSTWEGYALALSLIGSYLVERHGGDALHAGEIPPPTTNEARYERVHRVLRRYDEHLTEASRAFLMLFGAFRTPVHESAFGRVFRPPFLPAGLSSDQIDGLPVAHIAVLTDAQFSALVQRLCAFRLLRHDPLTGYYTLHPVVRAHYMACLADEGQAEQQDVHTRIRDYYLDSIEGTPTSLVLDDLRPLMEVVHHNCQAGAYDNAWRIFWDRIYRGERKVLVHKIGASDTSLNLLLEFFPHRDLSKDPQVSDRGYRRFILNEVGLRLADLGRLDDVLPFYERAINIAMTMEDWANVSSVYHDVIELQVHLGRLAEAMIAAQEALGYSRLALSTKQERYSEARQAWVAHLRGELEPAETAFRRAEKMEKVLSPTHYSLTSLRGVHFADHLRRTGNPGYARQITVENLRLVERNNWSRNISQCHRVLGDLDADAGQHESARGHYVEALRIARSISRRDVLIEALLARGRWAVRRSWRTLPTSEITEIYQDALSDLNEALGYALDGGYRIYETDIRLGLARALAGTGDLSRGRAEVEHAHRMCEQMGYYWGLVDAAKVLEALTEP